MNPFAYIRAFNFSRLLVDVNFFRSTYIASIRYSYIASVDRVNLNDPRSMFFCISMNIAFIHRFLSGLVRASFSDGLFLDIIVISLYVFEYLEKSGVS